MDATLSLQSESHYRLALRWLHELAGRPDLSEAEEALYALLRTSVRGYGAHRAPPAGPGEAPARA